MVAVLSIFLSFYRLIVLSKLRHNITAKIQSGRVKKPMAKLKERASKYVESAKELEETSKLEKDQIDDSILEELKKAN